MKTAEELNALKNEVEALNKKLAQLTDEELEQVTGGTGISLDKETQKLQGQAQKTQGRVITRIGDNLK